MKMERDPDSHMPTMDIPEGTGFRLFRNSKGDLVRLEITDHSNSVYAVNIPTEFFEESFSVYLEATNKKQ